MNFGKLGSCMILLLVWATFSNTFAKKARRLLCVLSKLPLLNPKP